uniref:VWFA domain-containing protein n=1 Tax=Ditylum brightwellii TaxID=49249 RepID=A0A7S4RKV0_9STRA
MSGAATKEAVMFILDSNASMNTPYSCSSSSSTSLGNASIPEDNTRLSCSKSAMTTMICDLMLQSKSNEAGVVVLKTKETRHHLYDNQQVVPFPNIVELSENGLSKPTINLLRHIQKVHSVDDVTTSSSLRGDFCDGIIVAADALYKRTNNKRYKRKIVLFTDAAHRVDINAEQMLIVVESLRKLDCTLIVIGLDFSYSAEFDAPAMVKEDAEKDDCMEDDTKQEKVDIDIGCIDDDNKCAYEKYRILKKKDSDHAAKNSDDDDSSKLIRINKNKEHLAQYIKSENEKLLISLARLTGGSVIAASTMYQILQAISSKKRIPKSMRRKMEFIIAPGLSINARFSLLISKASLPSLKKEYVMVNPDGTNKVDGLGEIMTSALSMSVTHWDADDENVEVRLDQQTKAFKYGSDLVPIGGFDLEGLKMRSNVSLSILGYVNASVIMRSILIGPTYAVYGDISNKRACVAISALSQGLLKSKKVAICRFVKSKDADPLIGALFPLVITRSSARDKSEEKPARKASLNSPLPNKLFFVQLPFAEDVQKISIPVKNGSNGNDDKHKQRQEARVCDELIDSLMLPKDGLFGGTIPNPTIRSFHKTVINRAVEPRSGIIFARSFCNRTSSSRERREGNSVGGNDIDGNLLGDTLTEDDQMSTPEHILQHAAEKIKTFRQTFPLNKVAHEDSTGRRNSVRSRRNRRFWSD